MRKEKTKLKSTKTKLEGYLPKTYHIPSPDECMPKPIEVQLQLSFISLSISSVLNFEIKINEEKTLKDLSVLVCRKLGNSSQKLQFYSTRVADNWIDERMTLKQIKNENNEVSLFYDFCNPDLSTMVTIPYIKFKED